MGKLPLAFHPGTAFRYSMAIDVLGYIVQVAAEQPFDEFLKEKIFNPLGMVDTGFWVPLEKVNRLTAVYRSSEIGELKVIEPTQGSRYTRPNPRPSGGGAWILTIGDDSRSSKMLQDQDFFAGMRLYGGLVSTIGDYFRFGQVLLNQGALDGGRLLGRKTMDWMLQNHLPEGVYCDLEQANANGFGLGGSVLLRPGLSHRPGSVGKFGWNGAMSTEWWVDSTEQLQCILMMQYMPFYMPAFAIPIVEDFAQSTYQALD